MGKVNLIQVITGPRQVGKTTAIKQVLASLDTQSHYCTADLPAPPNPSWINEHWQRARRLLADMKRTVILVLDEVQKIHRWSEEVKRLWDEDRSEGRDIRVAILGSSALLIQKGLAESLSGRFELLRFSHWEYKECARCFGWRLDQYIYFGGYPGAAVLIDNEERWKAYVRDSLIETAISKDILLMNPIEKPVLLRKLFVLACEYGGQVLSYQKMLGQLTEAGNTTTLAHYQRLLESAYLIASLEKYSGSKIRTRSSSPKWLPLNTALMTVLLNKSFGEVKNDFSLWGRLTECAVGAHLFHEATCHGLKLFYWREGNYEVDYVIQKGNKVIAVEVKSGRQKSVLSGMSAFEKRYNPTRALQIGISGIPVEDFLSSSVLPLFQL